MPDIELAARLQRMTSPGVNVIRSFGPYQLVEIAPRADFDMGRKCNSTLVVLSGPKILLSCLGLGHGDSGLQRPSAI
jgi:hypothetical protein